MQTNTRQLFRHRKFVISVVMKVKFLTGKCSQLFERFGACYVYVSQFIIK
jgi:hypothetical protein